MMKRDEMVNLTGLWEKVDKNGHSYWNGKINKASINVFPNPRRGQQGQPDYILYISNKTDVDTQDNGPYKEGNY